MEFPSRSRIKHRTQAERIADGELDFPRFPKVVMFSEVHDLMPETARLTRDLRIEPPRGMSPKKKRAFRRNAVIQIAATAGVSQRVLAEVFGLPRSLIATIVKRDLRAELSGPTSQND